MSAGIGSGTGNGTAGGLVAAEADKRTSQSAAPSDLASTAIVALRNFCAVSHRRVLTCAEAQKAVMRVPAYADHLDMAQRTIVQLKAQRTLLERSDGGLIFNDPKKPLTDAEIKALQTGTRVSAPFEKRHLPTVAICRDYMRSLGSGSTDRVRFTARNLMDKFEKRFTLQSVDALNLLNMLIEDEVLVPADTTGTHLVLAPEPTTHIKREEPMASKNTEPAAAPPSEAEPAAPAPAVPATPRKVRAVTSAERAVLDELRKMAEIRGLLGWLANRLGGARAADPLRYFLTKSSGILTRIEWGSSGRPGSSRFRVNGEQFDHYEFVIDATLVRSNESAVKRKPKKLALAPAAPTAPTAVADEAPLQPLAQIDRQITLLREHTVSYERALARRSELREELATVEKTVAIYERGGRTVASQIKALERKRTKVQKIIAALKAELAGIGG